MSLDQEKNRRYEQMQKQYQDSAYFGNESFFQTVHQDIPRPTLSEQDWQYLKIYGCFDLPPPAIERGLFDTFLEKCYPWMPVIDVDHYRSLSPQNRPIVLQQALCLAGSKVSQSNYRYVSSKQYYDRTKALIYAGYETNQLVCLSALCLIQWWVGHSPNFVTCDTSWHWTGVGIRVSQQVGLHRASTKPNYRLRKRIWWTLFVCFSLSLFSSISMTNKKKSAKIDLFQQHMGDLR